MESTAGPTVLALGVLALGYLVPHRVRQKQQWAQSRAEDRFSGALRVLATTGPDGGGVGRQRDRVTAVPPASAVRGIAAGPSRSALERGPAPSNATESRSEEGTQVVENIRTGVGAATREARAMSAGRLRLLERRAAAARRRLVLAVMLLLATMATIVVVVVTSVPWWAAVIPGVLLVLVLILGRRAARAARRSDAEWLAQRRAMAGRPAVSQRRPSASAGAAAPARVTGRAVHGSQAHTQMIPRVTPQDRDRDRDREGTSRAVVPSGGVDAEPRLVEPAADPGDLAHPEARAAEVETPGPEVEPSIECSPAPVEMYPASGRAWDPVPVPPPTYTLKSAAPRRGPEEPVQASGGTEDHPEIGDSGTAVTSGAVGPTPVAGPVPTRAVGDELKPKTETLGLDLNEILARRRVAGQ